VSAVFELEDVIIDVATANAAVDFDLHVVTQRKAYLLGLLSELSCWRKNEDLGFSQSHIDSMKRPKCKYTGLARATLTLHNDISLFHDRQDCSLLDSRGFIESV
jgi:hypothetical protein